MNKNNTVTVSVPGKVILMGDHSVVYGKPGLIAAINKRLTVSVAPHKTFQVLSDEPGNYVRHAVEKVTFYYKLGAVPDIRVTVTSDIPPGYHLGSSAAVAVGVVGACMYFFKKIWNRAVINQLAYEAEKYIHKTPSGVDNTAITFGGFLWYRKELEFLRCFWQLPLKLSPALNHFFLLDTGRPEENTGEMVSRVRTQYQARCTYYKKIFNQNEEHTKRMAVALKEGDEKTLIETIRKGEQSLERMGVVSTKVIPIIRGIETSGGAAKILGGGGKAEGVGYLLCYSHNPPASSIPIILGEEGIKLEKRA
jgi:mevalonate kinase